MGDAFLVPPRGSEVERRESLVVREARIYSPGDESLHLGRSILEMQFEGERRSCF